MKYDLLITRIDKSHKNTLAKLLCGDPSISLQKANSMLENLPIVYKKGMEKGEAIKDIEKLKALGAEVKPIESKIEEPINEILMPDDKIAPKQNVQEKPIPIKEKAEGKKVPQDLVVKRKQQNISRIGPPVKKKNKSSRSGIIVLIIFLVVAFLVVIQGSKKAEYKIKGDNSLIKKRAKSSDSKDKKISSEKSKKKINLNIFSALKEKKNKEKAQKIAESNNYSDSAEMFINEPSEMIKFYKIAISINRKNFNAWNGLINAYANEGMTKEAYKAKEEMEKIFGDEMLSVEKLVRPYGKLISFSQGKDGQCRLEYRSKSRKKVDLESESFNLLRSLNNSFECGKYSLYASTSKGKGLLVRYDQTTFPNTFSDYLLTAQVNFIE